MSQADPIELLFGGMGKLGPGSDVDTFKVLGMLPDSSHGLVVDAGCGTGRQTLALVGRLRIPVHAVDSYEPFLASLNQRARDAGIAHLVKTHCMDMAAIPETFQRIDLLWSEGAAYSIGFPHALKTWRSAVRPSGFVVASELCWLRDDAPADARDFFRTGYPDMLTVDQNLAAIEEAGYKVLATHTLPRETWVDGYYDLLEPRARALFDHPDEAVRVFAAETVQEIRVFGRSEDSYGYVFYVMQKT
jgi:SAM-dependent methyltransferase